MTKLVQKDIQKYTLGTWQFGGDMNRNPQNNDAVATKIADEGIERLRAEFPVKVTDNRWIR